MSCLVSLRSNCFQKSALGLFVLFSIVLILPTPAFSDGLDSAPMVQIEGGAWNPSIATTVGLNLTITVKGFDSDTIGGFPEKCRFIFKPAEYDGGVITTRNLFDTYGPSVLNYSDSEWSEWVDYPENSDGIPVTFPNLTDGDIYLLGAQVMDSDGAVSHGWEYGVSAINIQASSTVNPHISLFEDYLGPIVAPAHFDIAAGQPLNFSWTASAEAYGGTLVSCRHGWNLLDPNDPNDPGWSVPPGLEPYNFYSPSRTYSGGSHRFYVQAIDSGQGVSTMVVDLEVIPFVDPAHQYPLILVDQVEDQFSGAWPNYDQSIYYDENDHRNAYWRFLEGAGGVQGFDWNRDFDSGDLSYSELVNYKCALIYARQSQNQALFSDFRPINGWDQFVWLIPYQQQGGNVFLVGERSMQSFLEPLNYMVPIVFESPDEFYELNGESYVIGFGSVTYPNGTQYERGPRQYGFSTAGVFTLDWATVPGGMNIYSRSTAGSTDRKASCAEIKQLVLTPEFQLNHFIGPGVIAETLNTNPNIDWRDLVPPSVDLLPIPFPFMGSEFINADISPRGYQVEEQECSSGPNGLCIEPMFTGVSRFDWVREKRWAEGETTWPTSRYSSEDLDDLCGEMALESLNVEGNVLPKGTAVTNNLVYGYLSYKNVADKPSGKADVYWGFDPYRFNHTESQKAIRWVLEYFGLPLNR